MSRHLALIATGVLVDCKTVTIHDSYVTLIFKAMRFFERLFLYKLALLQAQMVKFGRTANTEISIYFNLATKPKHLGSFYDYSSPVIPPTAGKRPHHQNFPISGAWFGGPKVKIKIKLCLLR